MEKIEYLARQQYLSRIYSRLLATRPQSIAIIGDWQMGKSSLLEYICKPEVFTKYNTGGANPLFVLYDIKQNKPDWQHVMSEIIAELAAKTDTKAETDDCYQTLLKQVTELHTGYSICILLDNFELLTQNPDTPLEFFSFLRSLANTYKLAFITASRASLQSLCVSPDVCESPFFNIFTNLELKGMSMLECTTIFDSSSLKIYTDIAFELTGGHPGLLKQLIHWLDANTGISTDEMQSAFGKVCEPYCREWFEQFTQEYKEVLIALANQQKVASDKQYLVETLKRKGYLTTESKLMSNLFAEHICNNHPPTKGGMFARLFHRN
jgi:hypothetical protein